MDITVIGAGVVGMSCAFELSELGHTVTVVDSGAVGAGASAGNAGWITPFLSVPRAAPGAVKDAVKSFTSTEGPARMRPHPEPGFAGWILQFLRASSKHRSTRTTAALQEFSRHAIPHVDSLLERGVEFEHHEDGLAVVFQDASNLTHYEQVSARMRSLGYTGEIDIHRGAEISDFDPAISRRAAGVMHLRTERHVRPESLCTGLATALVGNGGAVIENEAVTSLSRRGVHWLVSTSSGRVLTSDQVVVAAGFASRPLLAPLGIHVPIEAAKGTSMTATGEGTPPAHALKLYEHMVACSPFGQAVRLSGTFDIGNRDFRVNRKRLDMVVRHGLTYLESWRPTRVETEWVGHRPTSVDDAPIIGPVPQRDGLYLATGHGTLGVTLGPATGALVAREIDGQGPQAVLEPLRPTRFPRLVR